MGLEKQSVLLNFSQGMDQKTDDLQLAFGKFLSLNNSVFDKLGRLTKRNGFGFITSLPDGSSQFLTTFNENLTAIGPTLRALVPGANAWVTRGSTYPVDLDTTALIRNNSNQSYVDSAVSMNGLVCTVYNESVPSGSTTATILKYAVADVETGQNVISPTQITSLQGTPVFAPKVFSLGNYFVPVFSVSSGGGFRLQYFSISQFSPGTIGSISDISTNYTATSQGAFDGVVANSTLFLSWNGSGGTGLKAGSLSSTFVPSSVAAIASTTASIVSVAADTSQSTPVIWSSVYANSTSAGFIVATNPAFGIVQSQKQYISSGSATIANLASSAANGVMNLVYEQNNSYTYDATVPTNIIKTVSEWQATGSVSNTTTLLRSVGLGSKAFRIASQSYFLSSYQSPYQPTYFLVNSGGGIVTKLSYSNGGGYSSVGLPSVTVSSSTAFVGYLTKATVQSVNKDTNVSSTTQVAGIYAQTGVNLAKFTFGTNKLSVTELGKNLNLNGGYLYGYDGNQPVENGFHVYPDSVQVTNPTTTIASGSANAGVFTVVGSLSFQNYFYQSTYEWSDNQGNLFRSSPSIPAQVTTVASASNTTGANVLKVPTLRLTSKTQNPVKIVIYRWSAAQQTYYQVTSITNPILNDQSVDFISYTDRSSDAAILGNNIIYTNGGVLENIGGPAFKAVTSFDGRLWGIDSEDQDILWYSKPVFETTPIEMTDLQTVFVSPNSSAQGPTGPCRCIFPMDDKLIIFKRNAIYYINGRGPDSTGAQNQYSDPIFITATVGCERQNSIVMTPNGLMFQSDKGIWMLGRDLSTNYIGKDVENYNADVVLSALTVPGTNQVRFTMASGAILMFDYFVQQWGTFQAQAGISSTLYQNLHTFIDSRGAAYQETPNKYLDGSTPVVMSFQTGWINLAGLEGYKRVYRGYVLGLYKSPHTLNFGIAYDFDPSITQLIRIAPDNYSNPYGVDTPYGQGTPYGGPAAREQWQLNFQRQQCQSFQITFNEYYDSLYGSPAGAGLTMSGIKLIAGLKGHEPQNISTKNRVG